MSKKRIALTMGDPAGIGPEICLRTAQSELAEQHSLTIFGDQAILGRVAEKLSMPVPANIVSIEKDSLESLVPGQISRETGIASFAYVDAAVRSVASGEWDAVATAPIHKEAWSMAGIDYPGHTELVAELSGNENHCMMLTSPEISCSLVTTHVGYDEVPGLLSTERIVEVIELSADAVSKFYKKRGEIVVLGLNPHAGENGLFGNREEERIIQPAIEIARQNGLNVVGPVSPDTAFVPSRRASTTCYVCMYHDQGLIPLKTIAFDHGVNVTLGLKVIRTSVDHGTGCDIAWMGKADHTSMLRAVELAALMIDSKHSDH